MSLRALPWDQSSSVPLSMTPRDTEHTLSAFAGDRKLSTAGILRQDGAIQRHLDKLEKWDDENFMKFLKARCQVLHLSQGNP